MRFVSNILLTGLLATAACGAPNSFELPEVEDDRAEAITLEGDALATELSTSPVRDAPVPFVRLGVMFDGDAPTSLEVSTRSGDGPWSQWQAPRVFHTELEEIATFAGEIAVSGEMPATQYRLRSPSGEVSFVTAEFLELTLSESLEDGEGFDDSAFVPIAIQIGDANVNSRSSWGAKAPRCVSNHTPVKMTIHHTVTPTNDSISPQARLRGIQSFHQNTRGWCDIGYQYLISRDGRLWEGRGATRLGSHVGGANTGNVGISFMGTHDSTSATSGQVGSVATLIRGLADRFGIAINRTKIKGHRQQGNTSCPGNALYAQMGTIVDRAKNGGNPPPPPPGSTTVKGVVYEGGDTSKRVSGATVKLGSRTATTNSIGYFEFTQVTGSSVTVTATASGFSPGGVNRSTTGEVTWANISLSKAAGNAGLRGVVYRGSNSSNRVPNALIEVNGGLTTRADANGYYTVENIAAGSYTVIASSGGDRASVTRTAISGELTWASVRL